MIVVRISTTGAVGSRWLVGGGEGGGGLPLWAGKYISWLSKKGEGRGRGTNWRLFCRVR